MRRGRGARRLRGRDNSTAVDSMVPAECTVGGRVRKQLAPPKASARGSGFSETAEPEHRREARPDLDRAVRVPDQRRHVEVRHPRRDLEAHRLGRRDLRTELEPLRVELAAEEAGLGGKVPGAPEA